MSNLNKFRKSTVAILTALLIISIAAPLASFATAAAAPTASLDKVSGPNGTLVKVSGTGFGLNEAVGAITITVDGLAGKAITTSVVGPPAATIDPAYQLSTDANGVLTGYFIIYNLAVGAHTVIISDASTNVVAGTFTITAPTVTVTPSTTTAGSSVTVSASGYPSVNTTIVTTFDNKVTAATFSGNPITIAAGSYSSTASQTTLSSNKITGGKVTATVSLPNVGAAGPIFTITDQWNNQATTTLGLSPGTVTLSPSSGPVGTWVTATVSGFGPSAIINTVEVGNIAGTTSSATASVLPVAPATTEQGTSVFLFQIPAGSTTTLAGVAGAQTVKVTDSKGNVGTATFTVTPKVTITLGTAAIDSTTSYVPVNTPSVVARITASGFKANTPLTIGYSPNIPSQWRTPSATWTPNTQINTANQLVTDANGQIATVVTDAGTAPAAAGQYWISLSDGTTTITTTISVLNTNDILVASVTEGAKGQNGVQFTYFGPGTTPTGAALSGVPLTVVPPVWVAASAWPTPTVATFSVPPVSSAGVGTLALTGGSFNTVAFTVLSPSVTVISPSSASVGTTVTLVGTGYANTLVDLAIQGATVTTLLTANMAPTTNILIVTFSVPNYVPGTYPLTVSDTVNTATTNFTVASPSIEVTPNVSTVTNIMGATTTIAIKGSGFKSNDAITVTFDGVAITAPSHTGLTVINTNGGMLINSGFRITNPTTAGVHTITVVGASGAYASATFTVQPKLNPLSAVRPGAQVTVAGLGFAANSALTLSINGTQISWYDTSVTPATVIPVGTATTSNLAGSLPANRGFVVSSTETSTALTVTVTDAAGNTATTTLNILATPTITVGSNKIVPGTTAAMSVRISGTGFTPSTLRVGGTPISAALYDGSTLVTAVTLIRQDTNVATITTTVGSSGAFPDVFAAPLLGFTIPGGITPGTYTLQFTIGTPGVSTPVETASTTVTVLGAPTIDAPSTVASGAKIDITVTGLTAITDAAFSATPLVIAGVVQTVGTADQFGSTTVLNTGENAYTKNTWFIVPTGLFAGTYLLTLRDTNTGLTVQTAMTVTPSIALTPNVGSKGTVVAVTGTGFAATSPITAKVNGQAVTLTPAAATTTATGALPAGTTFTIPVTSLATNTLTITDAVGNVATATFTLTTPQITLAPPITSPGSTVQIIGTGFTAFSTIVVQVNGQVSTTVPAALTTNGAGDFITYVTLPTGLSGEIPVTATDNSNNVGTATLTVSGTSGTGTPSQTTMSSTAQTTTASGTAATTFAAGSTVKAGFMLQSTSGSRDVVVAVTWQQGAKVYNMASFQTTMTTTASPVSFSNLIPAGATGTWTATLQVFAADGVTPLGVTTLTFTVS